MWIAGKGFLILYFIQGYLWILEILVQFSDNSSHFVLWKLNWDENTFVHIHERILQEIHLGNNKSPQLYKRFSCPFNLILLIVHWTFQNAVYTSWNRTNQYHWNNIFHHRFMEIHHLSRHFHIESIHKIVPSKWLFYRHFVSFSDLTVQEKHRWT